MPFRSVLRGSVLLGACLLLSACAETVDRPVQTARGASWSSAYTNSTEFAAVRARCAKSLDLPADTSSPGQIADRKVATKYEDCVVFAMREAAMDRVNIDQAQFNKDLEYERQMNSIAQAERAGQR